MAWYLFFLGLGVLIALGASFLAHRATRFPGDLEVARWWQGVQFPLLDPAMRGVTMLGWSGVALPIVLACALALLLVGQRLEAAFTMATLSADGLNSLLKALVARPRPADLNIVYEEVGPWGYPSGHVMHFTAFFGFLLYLAWTRLAPSGPRTVILLLGLSLIVLVGPSRVYLGAHWPSDVLAGYLIGGLCLAGLIWAYREVRARLPVSVDPRGRTG